MHKCMLQAIVAFLQPLCPFCDSACFWTVQKSRTGQIWHSSGQVMHRIHSCKVTRPLFLLRSSPPRDHSVPLDFAVTQDLSGPSKRLQTLFVQGIDTDRPTRAFVPI